MPSGHSDDITYPLFRAALDHGDLAFIRSNADRLPPIRLGDALRICLLIRNSDPATYERAALRWLGRFALEVRKATLEDLWTAIDALSTLADEPQHGMEQLSELCVRYGLGE